MCKSASTFSGACPLYTPWLLLSSNGNSNWISIQDSLDFNNCNLQPFYFENCGPDLLYSVVACLMLLLCVCVNGLPSVTQFYSTSVFQKTSSLVQWRMQRCTWCAHGSSWNRQKNTPLFPVLQQWIVAFIRLVCVWISHAILMTKCLCGKEQVTIIILPFTSFCSLLHQWLFMHL